MSDSSFDPLKEFFIADNNGHGKKFQVKGKCGPRRASALVEKGIEQFARLDKNPSAV